MNIVYHFRVRGTGAEGVHIAGIANGFRAAGHRVHFVSPSGIDPTAPKAAQDKRDKPSAMTRALHALADHAPQVAFEGMELAYNVFAIPKLVSAVRVHDAELIYERYAFFNAAGCAVSAELGVPLVIEVNELAGYERVRDQRLVNVARAMERRVFRRASLVVTVSDFLSERVRELTDDAVPVVTIPNGVSQSWFEAGLEPAAALQARAELGLADKRVLGFVGGLVHWHNFDLLLSGLAFARRDFPDLALLFVGDGPERKRIESRAAELGIESALCFVGQVSHRDTARFISLFDVAVVPHTNKYRSPIKLFEYMALGKPVIAPRMPPIESVMQDGHTGLLFDPGSVSSFADALLRALEDAELAASIGRRACDQVRQKHTWNGNAARILALVDGVLGRRSPNVVIPIGAQPLVSPAE